MSLRFSLTERLVSEAERYGLRSSCRDCFFFVRDDGRCAHGWPNRDQARDAREAAAGGEATVSFCKEFELA